MVFFVDKKLPGEFFNNYFSYDVLFWKLECNFQIAFLQKCQIVLVDPHHCYPWVSKKRTADSKMRTTSYWTELQGTLPIGYVADLVCCCLLMGKLILRWSSNELMFSEESQVYFIRLALSISVFTFRSEFILSFCESIFSFYCFTFVCELMQLKTCSCFLFIQVPPSLGGMPSSNRLLFGGRWHGNDSIGTNVKELQIQYIKTKPTMTCMGMVL